jgi:hypothetical protein
VITEVVPEDQAVEAIGFGQARGDRKHDAVTKWDHGSLHRWIGVVAFRDVAARF